MVEPLRRQLVPGACVEVTQQIPHRDRVWTQVVRGTVVSFGQKPTGSWFAHSRNHTLWLDRLILRADDGEIIALNLDEYSVVKIESEPKAQAGPAGAAAT